MNPDRLIKHFDQIIEAPDAVPRLRRFILDLAMRGKLVPHDQNDEPASELLKRIRVEEKRAVRRGVLKRQKDLPEIDATATGVNVPANWELVPLIRLGKWAIGSGFPLNEQGGLEGRYFFLKVSDMNLPGNQKYIRSAQNSINADAAARMKARIHPAGTIIFPKIGGAVATNKRRILTRESAIDNNCLGITFWSILEIEWCYLLLTSLDLSQYQAGTAVPALQQSVLEKIPVPLPPLVEQHRIVAKVDELMRVCDELEAAQAKRERRRDRLVAASLHSLNNGASEDDLHQNVGFYLNHIPRLTTRLEHIHQLRQTILNLAVSGKLVPQDPNDKPASEVLKAIEGEASRLFKSGKVRTQKSFQPVKDAEGLFALPGSWKWIRLLSLGITRTGNTPSKNNPEYFGNYIPFVKPADLKATGINYYGEGISREGLPYARLIPDGSVLMVCIGSSIGKVNRTERDICCNQQINAITPFIAACGGFLSLALKADFFRKLVLDHAGTGTLPIISKGKWEKLPVPLPPLAEQHRIVGKVKELMALCDELEARTNNTTTARRQLLEATLHEALFGRRELSQRALHAG